MTKPNEVERGPTDAEMDEWYRLEAEWEIVNNYYSAEEFGLDAEGFERLKAKLKKAA